MRPVRARETSEPTAAVSAPEREARLQEFREKHDMSIAAIRRAARVYKTDMKRWRHGKLSPDSVMAKRIENVLSGITPLPPPAREEE
jgi:ribosome-binding protein aMBF1 (putative translation factor)